MSLILILCREKNFQNIEAERTQPVIEPSLNKSDSLKRILQHHWLLRRNRVSENIENLCRNFGLKKLKSLRLLVFQD